MFEEFRDMICEYVEVNPDEINAGSRFIEDLHFNSYDFMSFLGEVEEKYDVTVNEEDVLNLDTVGKAIAYIENLRG